MSINHDPGPEGPSGEGEFVLFCIFLSYIFTFYNIVKDIYLILDQAEIHYL